MEWTKTSDRLPEESCYAWFVVENKVMYGRYVHDLQRFFHYDGGHYSTEKATHYQVVLKPEPPKQEQP